MVVVGCLSVSIWDPISSSSIVVARTTVTSDYVLPSSPSFSPAGQVLPPVSPLTLTSTAQDRDISYWNGCLTVSPSQLDYTPYSYPGTRVPILSPVSNDVPLIDSPSYTWLWSTTQSPLPTFALSVSVNYFSHIKARIPIVGCKPWIKFINTLCFDTFPDPALRTAS